MKHSFNNKAEEINVEKIKEGRICLGLLKVEMDRVFIFGKEQRLHEMISFAPGLGKGSYEVFAEVREVPGYGFRIVKVEMEFVTEEEIQHYLKKEADQVLEVAY